MISKNYLEFWLSVVPSFLQDESNQKHQRVKCPGELSDEDESCSCCAGRKAT